MRKLTADRVCVAFGQSGLATKALIDLSISFEPQELTLVRGPSGSGKSTLLAVLGLLLAPEAGAVRYGDQVITHLDESDQAAFRLSWLGFVFQSFRLFDTLSAVENVALPLQMAGEERLASLRRASALLERFGLAGKRDALTRHMSGGEQQRTALARALILDPPIILADEPTASVDSGNRSIIADALRAAALALGKTVVVVSHDEQLIPYAQRVVTLSHGRLVGDEKTPCAA